HVCAADETPDESEAKGLGISPPWRITATPTHIGAHRTSATNQTLFLVYSMCHNSPSQVQHDAREGTRMFAASDQA
ncbi:hypothetical protein ACFONL_16035, partial [Camelimonas fluminis]